MQLQNFYRRYRRRILLSALILVLLVLSFTMLVNQMVEPILRDRIHTLIIKGSDSLYTYELGGLNANFLGGNVEVENLQIKIDSARYTVLKERNALPSITMQLNLQKGYIKGLGVFALLFQKRISITEIGSSEADLKLSRHFGKTEKHTEENMPLWKAIRPKIKNIQVDRIRLDGIKMLYKNADTSESIKLQFDRCDARFDDIRIDSAATYDTSRLRFVRSFTMRFNDLKFRLPDSSSKLKAEWITYSSHGQVLVIQEFKIQPTREEKEDFYAAAGIQKSMEVIEFQKMRFTGIRLERFIHNNVIQADSLIIDRPKISIYTDKSMPPDFVSKIGKFPHQRLLKSDADVIIDHMVIKNGELVYTEKNEKTLQEGVLVLKDLQLVASNITNKPERIRQNNICTAKLSGKIFGTSPFETEFKFYLDSANGRFDMTGRIKNVNAAQLNNLTMPLASLHLSSLNIHEIDFSIRGEDFGSVSNLKMRYNDLSVVLKKLNGENGQLSTKKFLTRIVNKYVFFPDNPGPDGVERVARQVKVARLTDNSFFGLVWKSIFAGMQNVATRTGRNEQAD
jgi:hypothetical protein